MWTLNTQPDGELASTIVPSDVLYYYDGPTLFRAKVGLTDFLFYKVDEAEEADIFLLVPVSDRTIDAIKRGSLSVRGALYNSTFWLIELDRKLNARRYWSVSADEIPQDFLPDSGFGLRTRDRQSADSLEQAFSFFSVRFAGQELTQKSLRFGLFKGLVNDVYDSVRKIFPSPLIDQKPMSNRVFDFEVLEPRFGSLIIAVEEPVINRSELKKEIRDKFEKGVVTKSLEENRRHFFEKMTEIIHEASKGDLSQNFAIDHFITLDQVHEIIPTGSNNIDTVEFRAGQAEATKPIQVDDRLGGRIRRAYHVAESAPRRMRGVVVEINFESGTFIIKDFHHRLTTCISTREEIAAARISIHARVEVSGDFRRRSRRDWMDVRTMRVIS